MEIPRNEMPTLRLKKLMKQLAVLIMCAVLIGLLVGYLAVQRVDVYT